MDFKDVVKELSTRDILEGIIGAVGVVLSICFIFIVLAV